MPETGTMQGWQVPSDPERLPQQVERQCQVFTVQSGIPVSNGAREFIVAVLKAFRDDPHPRWDVEHGQHEQRTVEFLADLPTYLRLIARRRRGPAAEITSFDVIFWLSQNIKTICPYLCPF